MGSESDRRMMMEMISRYYQHQCNGIENMLKKSKHITKGAIVSLV